MLALYAFTVAAVFMLAGAIIAALIEWRAARSRRTEGQEPDPEPATILEPAL